MQIHRIRGRDLRDALERARSAHGEDAVVLSQESGPGGGITLSVTAAGPAPGDPPIHALATEPGARDVARRLHDAGATQELMRETLDAVAAAEARGAFAIDAAAGFLARRFRAAPSPKLGEGPRVLAAVGPTGAGKSTSLAKLVLRLAGAGRRVLVASLDTQRPGGTRLLSTLCAKREIPFTPVRYREDLASVMAEAGSADAVLLDTAGRSPRDEEHLGQLETVLEECLPGAQLTTYLTVPASVSPECLDEIGRGFARIQPAALVITKLDETRRTAVPLEYAEGAGLPVAFLATGQELRTDYYRATPDRMADLVLGGRVR